MLGLLALTRENALLLAPVVLLWILVSRSDASSSPRRAAAAAFVAGFLIALLPVALRNRAAGGEFHLTTSQYRTELVHREPCRRDGTYEPLVAGHG